MTLPVQELCAGLPLAMPLLPSHSYPLSGDVTNFTTCPGGFFTSALPTAPAAGFPYALPLPWPFPDGRPVLNGSYGPGWLAPVPDGTGPVRKPVTVTVVAAALCWKTPLPSAVPVAANSHTSPGSRIELPFTSPATYAGEKSSAALVGVPLSSRRIHWWVLQAPSSGRQMLRPMLPGLLIRYVNTTCEPTATSGAPVPLASSATVGCHGSTAFTALTSLT